VSSNHFSHCNSTTIIQDDAAITYFVAALHFVVPTSSVGLEIIATMCLRFVHFQLNTILQSRKSNVWVGLMFDPVEGRITHIDARRRHINLKVPVALRMYSPSAHSPAFI
jgi:hypothetical protein